MKVRILSGNAMGRIQDLPKPEAESAIAAGFAELVVEASPGRPPAEAPAGEKTKAEAPAARRHNDTATAKGKTAAGEKPKA